MKLSSNEIVFNNIYKYYKWGFGSGTGSVYILNKPFIIFINDFLNKHNDIKVVVDLGCGDWQIGSHIDLKGKKYIGGDVSSVVINADKKKFSNKNRQFIALDVVTDKLPNGDLVIVKDVLQHLTFKDIFLVLNKLKKYKYIIITNDICNPFVVNKDIVKNGQYRPIDITKEPFNFGYFVLLKKYTEGARISINFFRKLIFLPSIMKGIYLNEPS